MDDKFIPVHFGIAGKCIGKLGPLFQDPFLLDGADALKVDSWRPTVDGKAIRVLNFLRVTFVAPRRHLNLTIVFELVGDIEGKCPGCGTLSHGIQLLFFGRKRSQGSFRIL